MEALELLGALSVGFAAGLASGLVGVGGGVLFVPALVLFLEQGQLEAEATSLVAVAVTSAVGAARQRSYGNLRLGDGVTVGLLSPLGVLAGTIIANTLSERTLELGFAAVQLYFAYRLARRALAGEKSPPPPEVASG